MSPLRAIGAVGAWILFTQSAYAQPVYSITDLGRSIAGDPGDYAVHLNNSGQVAARDHTGAPFIWTNGVRQILPGIGNGPSFVSGIDDAGNACGASVNNARSHAVVWQNGQPVDLGFFGGSNASALAMNNLGIVAVSADNRSFRYALANGTTTDLGTLGGNFTRAAGINNGGRVVGYSDNASSRRNAFAWQEGQMQDLGALGGSSNDSFAYDVNEVGTVVGGSYVNISGDTSGFIYRGGQMEPLPRLPSMRNARAYAINNEDLAVGVGQLGNGTDVAMLWQDGVAVDLNTILGAGSGWSLFAATDVNESGQIVGWGLVQGTTHAFLLTPVPQPTSLAVAAAGLAACLRRRRSRHQ